MRSIFHHFMHNAFGSFRFWGELLPSDGNIDKWIFNQCQKVIKGHLDDVNEAPEFHNVSYCDKKTCFDWTVQHFQFPFSGQQLFTLGFNYPQLKTTCEFWQRKKIRTKSWLSAVSTCMQLFTNRLLSFINDFAVYLFLFVSDPHFHLLTSYFD